MTGPGRPAAESTAVEAVADPRGALDAMLSAYQRAAAASGGATERHYRIAGLPVRLCFAGAALLPHIEPALRHLASPPQRDVALTVCLFDSERAGVELSSPPRPAEAYCQRDDAAADGGRIVTTATPDSGLSVLDTGRNVAVFWIAAADRFSVGDTGSPLRSILHAWMRTRGYQLVHAGAVGSAEGGVLLVGKGGAGKSTSALACLESPLRYLGDDYCLVDGGSAPHAYSLYNSGRLTRAMVGRFPHLPGSAARLTETGKLQFFLHDLRPDRLIERFPIRAIVVPCVAAQRHTVWRAITPIAALRALAPSTIFQLPGGQAETLARLGTLVRRTPCFVLETGSDLGEIPAAIGELLRRGA
jgi:hypothetical protein